MPPALLSRFDLIFVLLDTPDVSRDLKIAKHILNAHRAGQMAEQRINLQSSIVSATDVEARMEAILPEIEPELMRKYIAYARKNIFPIIEENALSHLIDFYMGLRDMGDGQDSPIPVTARQLEALVRLSEASARIRFSNTINMEDARRTTTIVLASLKQVGIDPDTGKLDADVLSCGTSKSQRDKIKTMKDIISIISKRNPGGKAPLEDIYTAAENEQIDRDHAEDLIMKMRRIGELLKPDDANVRLV